MEDPCLERGHEIPVEVIDEDEAPLPTSIKRGGSVLQVLPGR